MTDNGFQSPHLGLVQTATTGDGPACLALVHNERTILDEFFRHYRGLGVRRFFLIDDRSDDGSAAMLEAQSDVTLFRPKDGSTYAQHKRAWRREILDHFLTDAWVALPDIDEHLVWPGCETSDLPALIDSLEARGSEALYSIMIDMYADAPLAEQAHRPGQRLIESFPLFDDNVAPPFGYRRLPHSRKYLRKNPSPRVALFGGVRDRLFFRRHFPMPAPERWLIERHAPLAGPLTPDAGPMAFGRLVRGITAFRFQGHNFNCGKIALMKWHRGLGFSGGPHSLTADVPFDSRLAALLHFKFAHGQAGMTYIRQRGQHASGSRFYDRMLAHADAWNRSPVFAGTARYEGSHSLNRIIGSGWKDAP